MDSGLSGASGYRPQDGLGLIAGRAVRWETGHDVSCLSSFTALVRAAAGIVAGQQRLGKCHLTTCRYETDLK